MPVFALNDQVNTPMCVDNGINVNPGFGVNNEHHNSDMIDKISQYD